MSQQIELACGYADRGSFDTAVKICRGIDPSRTEHAAALSLIASVLRQLGRHDLALGLDELGASSDDLLGRSMCRLGTVADHVGAGDPVAAPHALASSAARSRLRRMLIPGSERNRSGWVEIAVMSACFVIAQKGSYSSGSQ